MTKKEFDNTYKTLNSYMMKSPIEIENQWKKFKNDYVYNIVENNRKTKTLNEIREYIKNHSRQLVHPLTHEDYEMLDEENICNILQIIDKVLGDEK